MRHTISLPRKNFLTKNLFRNISAYRIVGVLFLILFSFLFKGTYAAVNITAPSVSVYPCPTFPTAYTNLGNIVITEGSNTDFGNGAAQTNVTFILAAPANFEFQPATGAVSFTAGRNITAATISVTATEITITLSNCAGGPCGGAIDVLTISGIRVRGITAATPSSQITRGGGTPAGGTAVITGAVVGGLTYGNLVSTTFPTPSAGTDQLICATSATFEAAAILDPNITGTWSLISGTGTIASPNSPSSTVTGLTLGDNVFQWTTTNGTCSANSLVTITAMSSGLGCSVASNQFSAVTNISPAMLSQDVVCPPSAVNVTQFTLANPGPFNVGDKVLVIQMQGAIVNTAAASIETGGANDAVFGSVTDYNGAGNYEYAIIATKVGSVVTFSQNLVNQYNVSGKVQLVTVPQFANYTAPATLTGTAWNSATGTGGVLVFEVLGTLTMNNSTISMDYRGFLGGGNAIYPSGTPMSGAALSLGVWLDGSSVAKCGMGRYSAAGATLSTALRGDGIASDANHLYGRGALANGGGSGGGWNSGAGGGSNICPGGRGGYEFSSCYNNMGVNPFYVGVVPTYNSGFGSVALNQQARMHGLGGYGLTASSNRVFMGGGGGAANGDGASATPGGNGGGIIIITANTIAGTSGTISANGQRGYANNIAPYTNTVDGTGGGGGGGSVILDVTTYSIGALTVKVNGGKGGNQDQANTCHGNGGGGGGGLIRHKGISPNVTLSATGGNIGVQRPSPNSDPDTDASLPLSNDNACAGGTTYGATPGTTCTGSAQQALIVVPQKGCCSDANLGADQTLCGTGSILLSNGTASNTNKTFRWYKNGILIGGATGPTYTATTSGTYTVIADSIVGGFNYCSVSDAVILTNSFPIPYLGPNQQLCSPSYLDLVPANVGSFPASTTWSWTYNGTVIAGETTPYLNGVTAAGTYTVTATTAIAGCGPTTASIALTTVLPTTVDACRSTTGSLTLSVSGGNGGPYEWYTDATAGSLVHTGTTYATPSLSSTTTYWVKDLGLYQTTIGPPISLGTGGSMGAAGNRAANSVDNQLVFDALADFYLRGLTVQYWANSCGGNVTYSINVSGASYTTQTRTGTAGPCGPGLQTYTITFATPIFIPAGTNYRIDPAGSSTAFAWYAGPFTYPATYSSMVKMVKNNSSDADAFPGFFDWQISYARNCARVPVVAQIGSCTPLPVRYISFTAEEVEDVVYLDWATASETNNQYFDIQRSIDGRNFVSIGRVNGQGTTHELNRYYFTDLSAPASTIYYRLQQTDMDGTTSLSKVVTVFNDKASSLSLYPNPFTKETNLRIQSKFDYKINIRILDTSGKNLYSSEHSTNENISVGEHLSDGVYIVEILSEYENKRVRVVKMNE